ncbi:hypothetical protein AB0H83_09525 [Dactylosporangium sp. NPDC050688]|uniref:hypothetical protein n=1 Tax=Dactylosporangium sp. NPDC050688 TaxID=3157217 RepID=UPI0033EA780D
MTLLPKLVLALLLVVGSFLARRRWRAAVGGTLVALPIVTGPILFITCIDQGSSFGIRAASVCLLGLASLATFTIVSAGCSRGTGWPASLAATRLATLAFDLGLARLDVLPFAGLALRALPPVPAQETTTASTWPWWDLPGRALATAGLVVAVTTATATVGPSTTDVLAPLQDVAVAATLTIRPPGVECSR